MKVDLKNALHYRTFYSTSPPSLVLTHSAQPTHAEIRAVVSCVVVLVRFEWAMAMALAAANGV